MVFRALIKIFRGRKPQVDQLKKPTFLSLVPACSCELNIRSVSTAINSLALRKTINNKSSKYVTKNI